MVDEHKSDDPSSELDRILVEYYQRIDDGEDIDGEQFIVEHSEHAEALADFLSAEQQLQREHRRLVLKVSGVSRIPDSRRNL